MFSALR
jgi:hypothetical protein